MDDASLMLMLARALPSVNTWLCETAISELFAKHRERAAHNLRLEKLAEFAAGLTDKDDLKKDALLHTFVLYEDAALRGASDKNLRLIARYIRNTLSQPETNLDKIIYYQKILSDLSEEEVFLVVQLWKHKHENTSDTHQFLSISINALVSTYYSTEADLISACSRLMRTGLVMPMSLPWGAYVYETTQTAEKLIALSEMHSF